MSHEQALDRMRRIHSCVFGTEVDAVTAVPGEAQLAAAGHPLDDYMTLPVDQYAKPHRHFAHCALSLGREAATATLAEVVCALRGL
jgi:hypothetical protein